MSDIRFNRWLHQSGTGGVSQDSSGNIGIGTTVPTMALDIRGDVNIGDTININNASGIISATTVTATTGTFSGNMSVTGNVSIAGTLTYEDVSNIDAVGIITAQSDIVVGGGLTVTGISTFNNDVKLLDSDKLKFGIGEDLQIYHDPGTGDSFISETGTGNLKLTTSSFRLRNAADTEHIIWANQDAEVRLYHDNSKKFETTSSGAIVTGILTASTFSGNLTGNVTGDLTGNLAGISSIAAISSTISDTAVDVFVYDTRKDSDGGAWRKRTQHTSWYNETLNTQYRGSRREFPAVAVIVADATTDKVTIYDGDDPDLPMWMVFSAANPQGILGWATTNYTRFKVAALNGILTSVSNDGGHLFKFVEDFVEIIYSSTNYPISSSRTIGGRNDPKVSSSGGGATRTYVAVTYAMNDVAMTVLPNAPIDDATGLPVPTIAVATDSGTSVIKDNGTVVDMTRSGYHTDFVEFIEYNGIKLLCYLDNGSGVEIYSPGVFEIPNSDVDFGNVVLQRFTRDQAPIALGALNGVPTSVSNSNIDKGNSSGLTRIYLQGSDNNSKDQSSAAYITSDYNTGYMHGDIKGAFLSDTDTTNATDSQKVNWNNGSDVSGSYGGTTAASATVVSNTTITITAAAGGYAYYDVGFTPVSGKKYVATLTGSNYSGSNPYGLSTGGGFSINMRRTSNGTVGPEVMTSAGNAIPIFVGNSVTVTVELTIYELAEEDRSVNNTGLQVVGTVTKSAVATGADLVAYSGFTNSNYMKQPYTSDMDFGTGDFSVTWWQKIDGNISNSEYIYDRQGGNGNRHAVIYYPTNNGRISLYTNASASSEILCDGINVYSNQWTCYTLTRHTGGLMEVYINGELKTTNTYTVRDLDNTSAELFIGIRHSVNTGAATEADFCLLRLSASIPSPEQIKKIYDDEKVLFKENAKATLYGSSDAVTALAFDDTTNLLHVGTSSGRSEFQGLRRINNTTTAVTTAISASDDLIAEQ